MLTWVSKITIESSKNIEANINNKFNVLERFIQNHSKEELADPQKLAESFGEVVKANRLKQMAIVTVDGTAYFDNGEVANLADRRYFKESIQGKRWISRVLYSKLDGRRTNVFSVPLYLNDDIVGGLFISVLTEELYEEFNLDMMKQIGDALIINTDGNIVVSEGMSVFNEGDLNLFNTLKRKGLI